MIWNQWFQYTNGNNEMQPVVDLKDCVIVHVTPDIHVSHTSALIHVLIWWILLLLVVYFDIRDSDLIMCAIPTHLLLFNVFCLILVSYHVYSEIIHSHASVVSLPKISLGTSPPPPANRIIPWTLLDNFFSYTHIMYIKHCKLWRCGILIF